MVRNVSSMIMIGMISAQSVNLANISDHTKPSKKSNMILFIKGCKGFLPSLICRLMTLPNLYLLCLI